MIRNKVMDCDKYMYHFNELYIVKPQYSAPLFSTTLDITPKKALEQKSSEQKFYEM